jgi:fucose permease
MEWPRNKLGPSSIKERKVSLVEKRNRSLYVSLFIVYLLVGTSMTIIGASLPKLISDFSWQYGIAGAVIAASSAAFAGASMASGFFISRLGPKATIAIGAAIITAGLAFFAAWPSAGVNFALNLLIGAGQGLLEPAVNWSVLRMNRGEGNGRSMTFMHAAFAIGAVAGPAIVGILIGLGVSWTLVYRCIAMLFGILALVCLGLPFGRLSEGVSKTTAAKAPKATSVTRTLLFWLGSAVFLLYVGTELGISTWIAEYSVSILQSDPARASVMVSLFWFGILAGRIASPLVYRGKQQNLLVSSAFLLALSIVALCILGFANLAPSRGLEISASVLVLLSGLGCSVIYPVAMSLIGAAFPSSEAQIVAAAVASGGIGLLVFPFVMSWISQAWGIKVGFLSYAILGILTFGICAALAILTKRPREPAGQGVS